MAKLDLFEVHGPLPFEPSTKPVAYSSPQSLYQTTRRPLKILPCARVSKTRQISAVSVSKTRQVRCERRGARARLVLEYRAVAAPTVSLFEKSTKAAFDLTVETDTRPRCRSAETVCAPYRPRAKVSRRARVACVFFLPSSNEKLLGKGPFIEYTIRPLEKRQREQARCNRCGTGW